MTDSFCALGLVANLDRTGDDVRTLWRGWMHSRSEGRSRDEIVQILTEELSVRGIEMPERGIGPAVSVIQAGAEIIQADAEAQSYPPRLIGQLRGMRLFLRVIKGTAFGFNDS